MVIRTLSGIERFPSSVIVQTAPLAPRSTLVGTSLTANTIEKTTKTFVINEPTFSVAPGVRVRMTSVHQPDNWMEGQIVSYDGTNLAVAIDLFNGEGEVITGQGQTYDNWNVGVVGARGERGPEGPRGAEGQPGTPGGPKGDTGETGPQGIQGEVGPQGPAATVNVGSTTTLPTGSEADVVNVGTSTDAILNFTIPGGGPIGPKGDKGDTGDPGPLGLADPPLLVTGSTVSLRYIAPLQLTADQLGLNIAAPLQVTANQLNINTATLFASPALTGTPTVPTATAGTNTTQAANTQFVGTAIAAIPLADYLPLAGGTVTGNLGVDGNLTVTGTAPFLRLTGGTITGGVTFTSAALTINGPGAAAACIINSSNSTSFALTVRTAAGGPYLVMFTNQPGAGVGNITTDGASVSYNTSSDERLKTDEHSIAPEEADAIIDALEPLQFRWRNRGGKEQNYGFAAQVVHAMYPFAVTPGRGDVGDEDFVPWMMDYSKLIPIIVAELKAVRRRLAVLEGARES